MIGQPHPLSIATAMDNLRVAADHYKAMRARAALAIADLQAAEAALHEKSAVIAGHLRAMEQAGHQAKADLNAISERRSHKEQHGPQT